MDSSVISYAVNKSLGIGTLKLGQSSVFQNLVYYRIFTGKLLQYLGCCGIACFTLLATWKLKLLKQNFAQLFGRVDVEALSGFIIY